jgi:radical SAM superfamily enzyme YgiQ (UPF0313 family)
MEEIDLLMREYGIKGIKFADDTFTLRPTRLGELCRDLKRRSLFWIGNARADTLDREMLIMIRDSGCALLQIGVESGVPEILEQLQKGITVEQVRRVFKWTNEVGIDTLATFIFGAPAETRDTVEQTIQFAKEIRPTYANFFIMSPYPDSDIYRYMASRDMIAIDDWAKVKSPKYENYIINHPNFSSKQLKQIQSRAYREFYFNPDYIFSSLFKLNSWSKLKGVVKLALTILDFTRH